MIGAEFPYEVDGLSLVSPGKKRKAGQKREKIYSEEYMKGFPKVAMIQKDIKYIYHVPEGRIVEVYDLTEDDGEQNNLKIVGQFPDSYTHMEKEIQDWLISKERLRNKISKKRDQAEIDPRTLEQLKSLGYIQHEGEYDQPSHQ